MASPLERSWKSLMYFVNYFHNDFTYKEYNLLVYFHNEWELNESHILHHSTEIRSILALNWNIHYKKSLDLGKKISKDCFYFFIGGEAGEACSCSSWLEELVNHHVKLSFIAIGSSSNGNFYICVMVMNFQTTNSGVRNKTPLIFLWWNWISILSLSSTHQQKI